MCFLKHEQCLLLISSVNSIVKFVLSLNLNFGAQLLIMNVTKITESSSIQGFIKKMDFLES